MEIGRGSLERRRCWRSISASGRRGSWEWRGATGSGGAAAVRGGGGGGGRDRAARSAALVERDGAVCELWRSDGARWSGGAAGARFRLRGVVDRGSGGELPIRRGGGRHGAERERR